MAYYDFIAIGDTVTEEEQKIEQRILPWRFWFAAALTAFLVVTFILYLPLRFQHQAVMHKEKPMMGEAAADHHGAARYHEEGEVHEGLAVNLNVTPVPVAVGTSTRLDFFVNKKPGNAPVPTVDLEVEHTKLMHVIGVRNDMNEFFHIHPEYVAPSLAINGVPLGVLSVYHAFTKPGLYKVWSEIKKDGVVHTFGHPEIEVQGTGERSHKEILFGRNVIVGNYQVALALDEPAAKGVETELAFNIHTLTGQEAVVEPYLGAPMHLAIIKDDLKRFIHTHPVVKVGQSAQRSSGIPPAVGWSNFYYRAHPEGHDMKGEHGAIELFNEAEAHGIEEEGSQPQMGDKTINFHVTFPEAGLYKLFAQFRPKGSGLGQDEALTAAFWVRVEEQKPFAVSAWWRNLLVSAGAIVVLSMGVKKFLQAKTQ